MLLCDIFPQLPAATDAALGIAHRRMILVTVNGSFRAASIGDKNKVFFGQRDLGLHSIDTADDLLRGLLRTLDIEENIRNTGIELELHACVLKVFLHRQDQGIILVVFCELQCREIRESADMMDETLEIQLHLQGTMPGFKSKHGAPVQPERRAKYLIIEDIFYFLVIKVFVTGKEQLHNLHAALLA